MSRSTTIDGWYVKNAAQVADRRQRMRDVGRPAAARRYRAKRRYYARPSARRANVWQELGFAGSALVLAAGLMAASMMVYSI